MTISFKALLDEFIFLSNLLELKSSVRCFLRWLRQFIFNVRNLFRTCHHLTASCSPFMLRHSGNFAAGTKTIPNRGSVHTKDR